MKIRRISQVLILTITLTFPKLAVSDDNSFSDLLRECVLTDGKTQCWTKAEKHLQSQPHPSNSQEFSEKLEHYYLLAKSAHFAGDFKDADRLFENIRNLNDERGKYANFRERDITPMIDYDHAMLLLSLRSFESALLKFKNAENSTVNTPGHLEFKIETSIGTASALVGLSRWEELEVVLSDLTSSLNFKQLAPWEAWLFGPQSIGPYSTGRRIVAAYVRMKQYDRALDFITQIEKEYEQVMTSQTDPNSQPIQMRPWAALSKSADFKNDKAEILIRKGQIDDAEAQLKLLLQINLAEHPEIKRRTLLKLAEIDSIKGKHESQQQYLAEANKLMISEQKKNYDPLAETFGYLP